MTPADIDFMRLALAQARLAAERGEVPVGAVLVQDGKVELVRPPVLGHLEPSIGPMHYRASASLLVSHVSLRSCVGCHIAGSEGVSLLSAWEPATCK